MNIDVHPEHLIDREIAGELTDDDAARLDEHLDRCVACRLERQLRLDFAVELDPHDAEPISAHLAGVIVDKTTGDDPPPSVLPDDLRPAGMPPPILGRRGKRPLAALAVAALVLATGLAAAQSTLRLDRRVPALFAWALGGDEVPSAPSARAQAGPRPRQDRAPIPSLPSVEAPASASTPAPEQSASSEASAAPSASAAPATAGALFKAAGEARRSGDVATAMRLYGELQRRYPGSSEAHVGTATVARLQLDSGNPAAALRGFDAYLASGHDALRLEAMGGRALALRRLRRRADEDAAWTTVITAYPRSGYAALGRARLGIPSATPPEQPPGGNGSSLPGTTPE